MIIGILGVYKMKIKHKIGALFILSIFISVLVFAATFYNLINKGYLSGITPDEMRQANEKTASLIETSNKSTKEELATLLNTINGQNKTMRFSILLEGNEVIGDTQSIDSLETLVTHLSQNEEYDVGTWIVARPIQLSNQKGYLITEVDKNSFKTITYYFNGPKARGVVGKMVLLGLAMTLVITSLVTYLFSRNIMKRMKKIDQAIDEFELGHLKIRIDEQNKDEIGKLAYSFNDMADKIEQQVKEQQDYEEKRKQLISNISHDLRTPLASVVGYSELLLDIHDGRQEDKRYIEIIHRKALYMEKLLGELLEFSRLENGTMKVQLNQGDIVECIREILIEYLPSIDEQNVELILELEENPIKIWFDQDKIERVIRNLIENAFKYGMDKKKLRIAAYKKKNQAIIEIEDFGEGMDEETLRHIFERFYRGDKGRSTKSGGMGLGLSIAQEIIRRHGGSLEIISEINKGTKAIIQLPIN